MTHRLPIECSLETLEPRLLLSGLAESQALELFATSPALFVENMGQWEDESVRFVHDGAGCNVAMTDSGPVFRVFRTEADGEDGGGGDEGGLDPLDGRADPEDTVTRALQFSASFDGAGAVTPTGLDPSESRFNYCLGDPSGWVEGAPSFERVAYENLYDGVDLVTWGLRSHLKYEFRVAPGADYTQVAVSYEGIEGLSINEAGELVVELGDDWGQVVDDAPYIYQEIGGEEVEIPGRFVLLDADTYAFELTGDYDPAHELVLDPELDWSTYLGGGYNDWGRGIAADGDGVYVTGSTYSSGWTSGGFDTSHNGDSDVFVAKMTAAGEHVWSTYLGGVDQDKGHDIAADGGDVYVTGYTKSYGWTDGGFDTSYNGDYDAFVAKLTATGAHAWSTYLGGGDDDRGHRIAADGGGVYVTGGTTSSGWTSGGFDTSYNGGGDALVAKLTATGGHAWSTYLGGGDDDFGHGIAATADGVVVTGNTDSSGWMNGGFDTSFNGGGNWGGDAFVVKLTATGAHAWSTYLGGGSSDFGNGIAVDGDGVVVTGYTYSSGWTSGGFDTSHNGDGDAFVAKLTASGAHDWSTYLGGGDHDEGNAIAADGDGVVVTGNTGSSGWTSGGFDTSFNGGDAFVAKLTTAGAHAWSTYLGGEDWEKGFGIAADCGDVYVTGFTNSSGWTSGGFDTSHNGDLDAFVARIFVLLRPTGLYPSDGEVDVILEPILSGSAFSSGGAPHQRSHWQLAIDEGFQSLVWEEANDTDTNLETEPVPGGLLEQDTAYYWRVRYQDDRGYWSGWSEPNRFTTLYVMGDFDANGVCNGLDIPGFKHALNVGAGQYYQETGIDADVIGDFDGNGYFNGLDIPGFKAALAGGVATAGAPLARDGGGSRRIPDAAPAVATPPNAPAPIADDAVVGWLLSQRRRSRLAPITDYRRDMRPLESSDNARADKRLDILRAEAGFVQRLAFKE